MSFELESDLLMALESLSDSLIKVNNGRNSYLKWSLIFGHTVLQSSMCLSLITCSTLLVRKRESYKNNFGDLDNIEWLYLKLQKSEFLTFVGSETIPEVKGQLSKVQRLQEIRNTFIHQQPDLYCFTFEELVELIKLTVELTRFLISKSQRMALGANVTQADLESLLDIIESQLTSPSLRVLSTLQTQTCKH